MSNSIFWYFTQSFYYGTENTRPVLPQVTHYKSWNMSSEQSRVKAADKKVFTAGVKCRLAPPPPHPLTSYGHDPVNFPQKCRKKSNPVTAEFVQKSKFEVALQKIINLICFLIPRHCKCSFCHMKYQLQQISLQF